MRALLCCLAAAVSADDWSDIAWLGSNASTLYRGNFSSAAAVNVTVDVAGLSFSRASLNGAPLDERDALTTSGWTRVAKRVLYASYAAELAEGENVPRQAREPV